MASRRTIGRILSLGHAMPGPRVDNYNFCSAPSFFDYDALVVDVAALDAMIDGVISGDVAARTYTDLPVVGDAATPGSVALLDLLQRRRDETARLLANGGVVIVFAQPQMSRVIQGVAYGNYDWLPLPADIRLDHTQLIPGEGNTVGVVDHLHPASAFVSGQSANIAYRAHVSVAGIEGFAERGGRVFARSRGGGAVGVEVPSDSGRVVLLPALAKPPSGEARYAASDALQRAIRRMLGSVAEGVPPTWLAALPVPGLEQQAKDVTAAKQAHEASKIALDAAEARHAALARYRQLLWQDGSVGLDEVAVEALRLIGFHVYDLNPEALELRAEGASLLLEIEVSEGVVGMDPHHRLRQRIEAAIDRRGEAARGLLLVNGFRLASPASRGAQASPSLLTAAETMRYCVATTTSLFDAVVAQLSGDHDAVAHYRSRIVSTDGLLA